MSKIKISPDDMSFTIPYNDNSGIMFEIKYRGKEHYWGSKEQGVIYLYGGEYTSSFPINKIDWLIEGLKKIKKETQ